MGRAIVIVARERRDLYEYFTQGFAGIEAVEVILDRRVTVARGAGAPPIDADRRREIDVHEELVMRGFIIRKRDEPRRADSTG